MEKIILNSRITDANAENPFVTKIIKKEIKGKNYSSKNVLQQYRKEQEWRKLHPKLAKLQDIWWWIRFGIWQKIEEFPRNVKAFIQRGKRGYADRDVWGFDIYLADVILGGIDKLIKDLHGYPINTKNLRNWRNILRKISKTFKTARKIQEGSLRYFPEKEYSDKQKRIYFKAIKETNKSLEINDRMMTKRENREYELGWELFKIHFQSLWD